MGLSRLEELMIAYFTLLVGEYCSNMMINKTLKHKQHNVIMISALLIVNPLYPYVALGSPLFLKQNSRLFPGFPTDILNTFKQQN